MSQNLVGGSITSSKSSRSDKINYQVNTPSNNSSSKSNAFESSMNSFEDFVQQEKKVKKGKANNKVTKGKP